MVNPTVCSADHRVAQLQSRSAAETRDSLAREREMHSATSDFIKTDTDRRPMIVPGVMEA